MTGITLKEANELAMKASRKIEERRQKGFERDALDSSCGCSSNLYVAICSDRHIDDVIRVFSSNELAIQFCKDWIEDEEVNDEKLNLHMVEAGWTYYVSYNCEGDHVRVEAVELDDDSNDEL